MKKRIGIYLKEIWIKEGIVFIHKAREKAKSATVTNRNEPWLFKYKAEVLQPHDIFNVMAAGEVLIHKISKDEETGDLYDLDEKISTNLISYIRIRQFEIQPITTLCKERKLEVIVFADIEF